MKLQIRALILRRTHMVTRVGFGALLVVGILSCDIQSFPDADGDSIADGTDNCINIANTNQTDTDQDGMGDVCDSDPDNTIDSFLSEIAVLDNLSDYYSTASTLSSFDTVVLASIGGPRYAQDTTYFEFFAEDYQIYYVDQFQHMGAAVIPLDAPLSEEEAGRYNRRSAALLYATAKQFHEMGKDVVILSHSFGSFITPFLIYHFSDIWEYVDHIIIAAGRIDMNDTVWMGYRDGVPYGFASDGVTLVEPPITFPACFEDLVANNTMSENCALDMGDGIEYFTFLELVVQWTSNRLQAAFGKLRYSQLLADKDMSNVTYIYGTLDQAVGALTAAEISFLEGAQATVVAYPGDHGVGSDEDGSADNPILAALIAAIP